MARNSEGPRAARQDFAPHEDRVAAELRRFGLLGIFAMLVIMVASLIYTPLSALLVLAWTYRSRTPWREIGFVRPRRWFESLIVGVAFGIAFKLLMKAVVMPLLGAPLVNQAYHYLAGNRGAMPAMIFLIIVGAGFGEETVYRGYLFERLSKLIGTDTSTKVIIVALTSILFGVIHYPHQGIAGAQQAVIVGFVFGGIYALGGRLWLLMCTHAAFDLTALALIYWDREADVARLVLG
jgi:membrane protease YdiL (CAAX protease family)